MSGRGPEPDDFGLSGVKTLARVGDPTPAREHSVFWSHWLSEIDPVEPVLAERAAGGVGLGEIDPTDRSCTHGFESVGGVRIGCRLVLPPTGTPLRAGLVSTHGYGVSGPISDRDDLFASVVERGVAVLHVRVRGYAGSRLDTGDLQTPGEAGLGWITVGLDAEGDAPGEALNWVYPRAIADVFQACRVLRRRLAWQAGREVPISLHGESFGGGLAVVAAAKLEGRGAERARVDRLVLGLPTMGDWPWRLEHPARTGAGGEIQAMLERRPEASERIRTRLRLVDSVVHASRIRSPVLCKLAERDEVVPAPTAAAVFNALRVDPGQKWRFVVPHGHAETGLANARRHAEFERCAADFLDPSTDPTSAMRRWADRLNAPALDDAGAGGETGYLFAASSRVLAAADAEVARAYERVGRTLDDLPYTAEFEELWSSLAKATNMGRRELFHLLHTMRKAGRLPRVGRARSLPPKIDEGDESLLAGLVVEAVGSMGQRDRLPYTSEFDRVLEAFNVRTGRGLSPHDCWRLIAKLAK